MSILSGSQANFKDVVFEECKSGNGGGVVILGNSVANFQDVHFLSNRASGGAGAVYISTSLVTFKETIFENNEVSLPSFFYSIKSGCKSSILSTMHPAKHSSYPFLCFVAGVNAFVFTPKVPSSCCIQPRGTT